MIFSNAASLLRVRRDLKSFSRLGNLRRPVRKAKRHYAKSFSHRVYERVVIKEVAGPLEESGKSEIIVRATCRLNRDFLRFSYSEICDLARSYSLYS